MELKNAHILIVDDNPANIQLLGSVLKEAGYLVEYALSGKDALSWLDEISFDLVLLDVMMPEMDGFEVCNRLKENPGSKNIPIIFLTSKTETESIIRGFEVGAADYISKPFERKELLARVHTHIKLKNAQRELSLKNKALIDSISYAHRIQQSMLPSVEDLASILNEYFLFHKPKDIVSGDFLWLRRMDDQIVLAVADGTGHGVPGAFMSMLGISLLHELIPKNQLKNPGSILDQMRERVKTNLGQSSNTVGSHDGIDIALCVFSRESMHLNFAGAFNSVYIIRNKDLQVIKGDSQPIGIYPFEHTFTSHEFNLNKGDAVYLFSDGFADQFGGEKNRKYMIRNLRNTLLDIAHLPMAEQNLILQETFLSWKHDQDQVDDVIILGFRI